MEEQKKEDKFDDFAKTLGVKFKDNGIEIPYEIEDHKIFKLLTLHYLEKHIATANVKWLIDDFIMRLKNASTLEEIKKICEAYSELNKLLSF